MGRNHIFQIVTLFTTSPANVMGAIIVRFVTYVCVDLYYKSMQHPSIQDIQYWVGANGASDCWVRTGGKEENMVGR
jgi:hypothetical protein